MVSPAAFVASYPMTPRSKTISTVYPTSGTTSLLVVPFTTVRASQAAICCAVRTLTKPVAGSQMGLGAQRPLKVGELPTAESGLHWALATPGSRGYHQE